MRIVLSNICSAAPSSQLLQRPTESFNLTPASRRDPPPPSLRLHRYHVHNVHQNLDFLLDPTYSLDLLSPCISDTFRQTRRHPHPSTLTAYGATQAFIAAMYPGQGHGPGNHHHGGPPPQWGPPQGQGQWGPPPQPNYGGYNGPPQHQYHQGPPQPQYHQGPPQGHYPPPHPQQYPPQQGYGGYPSPQPPQQQYHQPPSYSGGDGRGYGGGGAGVPQGMQRFGHGAPDSYQFQYSQCTGKRKALLIGINYFGTSTELKGCINDVNNVSSFLTQRYHYRREDMVILTDNQANPVQQPTKANILRAMQWLVKDAQPNDSLFLHYSGTQIFWHQEFFFCASKMWRADLS